jgi:hypothetical protein
MLALRAPGDPDRELAGDALREPLAAASARVDLVDHPAPFVRHERAGRVENNRLAALLELAQRLDLQALQVPFELGHGERRAIPHERGEPLGFGRVSWREQVHPRIVEALRLGPDQQGRAVFAADRRDLIESPLVHHAPVAESLRPHADDGPEALVVECLVPELADLFLENHVQEAEVVQVVLQAGGPGRALFDVEERAVVVGRDEQHVLEWHLLGETHQGDQRAVNGAAVPAAIDDLCGAGPLLQLRLEPRRPRLRVDHAPAEDERTAEGDKPRGACRLFERDLPAPQAKSIDARAVLAHDLGLRYPLIRGRVGQRLEATDKGPIGALPFQPGVASERPLFRMERAGVQRLHEAPAVRPRVTVPAADRAECARGDFQGDECNGDGREAKEDLARPAQRAGSGCGGDPVK